jgi:hypothetical protein
LLETKVAAPVPRLIVYNRLVPAVVIEAYAMPDGVMSNPMFWFKFAPRPNEPTVVMGPPAFGSVMFTNVPAVESIPNRVVEVAPLKLLV